jgi:fatty acid desaturase
MSKGDRLDRGRTQPCSVVMKNLAVPLVAQVVLIVLVILVVLVALVLLIVLVVLVVLLVLVIMVILTVLVGRGSEVQFEPAEPRTCMVRSGPKSDGCG